MNSTLQVKNLFNRITFKSSGKLKAFKHVNVCYLQLAYPYSTHTRKENV